jgi:hypothetical protein
LIADGRPIVDGGDRMPLRWGLCCGLGGRLDPLGAPGGGFEGVGEVLSFVDDFAVAELHDANGEGRAALVGDGVFGDPEIARAEDAPDVEAGGMAGMMAAEGLKIAAAEDSLAGLGIIADDVVGVDVVFGVEVAGCGGLPMGVEGFADLILLHGGLRRLGTGWRVAIVMPCRYSRGQ